MEASAELPLVQCQLVPIVIVDDHEIIRYAFSHFLAQTGTFTIVGETGSSIEAQSLIAQLRPRIAIIDISLRDGDGLELIKSVHYRFPSLLMLAYSMHDEEIYAERACRAGAKGYLMKTSPLESLETALDDLLLGKVVLGGPVRERVLARLSPGGTPDEAPLARLTDREVEVFRLIGKGTPISKIAAHLCLSVKTIETYRENLKKKLGLANAGQLNRFAVEWSLKQERSSS